MGEVVIEERLATGGAGDRDAAVMLDDRRRARRRLRRRHDRDLHAEWCIRRRRRMAIIRTRSGDVSGRAAGCVGCGEDSDAGSGVVWSAWGLIASTPVGADGPRSTWPPSRGLTERDTARPSPAAKIMTSTMAAMWRRIEDRTDGRAGLAVTMGALEILICEFTGPFVWRVFRRDGAAGLLKSASTASTSDGATMSSLGR